MRVANGNDQVAFGSRLRVERERCGLTLEAIAHSTKIKQSLLAALERGDVSAWPGGLFRRAHLRDYVSAIGLAPEPLVAEFVRLFPERDSPLTMSGDPGAPLALPVPQLPAHRPDRRPDEIRPLSPLTRARAAAFDIGAVVLLASGAALATGIALWMLVGIVAFGYLTFATAVVGRSFGAWILPCSDGWLGSGDGRTAAAPRSLGLVASDARRPAATEARGVEAPLDARTRRAS